LFVERIHVVVYIYPVEPNLCERLTVTDSVLGEYMVDARTSSYLTVRPLNAFAIQCTGNIDYAMWFGKWQLAAKNHFRTMKTHIIT